MTLRLPPEIVSHIFGYCVVDEDKYVVAEPSALPLVLAAVCSQWRAIALSTPALWASVYLESCTEGSLELLKFWLAHTGTRFISVRFTFQLRKRSRRALAWRLIAALVEHGDQLEDINIRLPEPVHRDDLNIDQPFPSLRRLTLELPYNGSSFPEEWAQYTVADLRDAPLLTSVQLVNWNQNLDVLLPWEQLTTITLNSCRIPHEVTGRADDETIAIFQGLCPNLVKCTLIDTLWDEGTLGFSSNKVTHDGLRELYLYGDNVPVTAYFVFPALQCVRLHHDSDIDVDDVEAHEEFCAAAPELHRLWICSERGFRTRDLRKLLRVTPYWITELTLQYATVDARLKIDEVLAALRDSANVVLPNLQYLEFIPGDGGEAFPYATLMETLTARGQATDAWMSLTGFRITIGGSLDEDVERQFNALREQGMDIRVQTTERE